MKKWMKRTLMLSMIASVVLVALTGCSQNDTSSKEKMYKVGIVQLVEHNALDQANQGFVAALKDRGYVQGNNLEIDQQNAQGDQSNLNTIGKRFVTDKVDLIAAIATPSAQTMANQTKSIPIVGMAITDYEAAKLVKSNEMPGGNLTGASDRVPTEKTLDLILALQPNIQVIGAIYSSSEVNSEVQIASFEKAAAAKGITVKKITVSNVNEIQQAAMNLAHQGVQAVYIPTDNVVASSYPSLMKVMQEAKIPVYPSESSAMKAGGTAMYSIDYYKLGYQAGEMAADILSGKQKPAEMAIQTPHDLTLYINEEEVNRLGLTVPETLQQRK